MVWSELGHERIEHNLAGLEDDHSGSGVATAPELPHPKHAVEVHDAVDVDAWKPHSSSLLEIALKKVLMSQLVPLVIALKNARLHLPLFVVVALKNVSCPGPVHVMAMKKVGPFHSNQ